MEEEIEEKRICGGGEVGRESGRTGERENYGCDIVCKRRVYFQKNNIIKNTWKKFLYA